MVKCVVSGCPNREVTSRSVFNRAAPKRFFKFPKDPARVKVWLAALRETDKQDSTEQHVICEDHFLPEDISFKGVNSDAIPIMPPCLDGPMGMISPWGAESSEEEDQWGGGGGSDDDDDEAHGGGDEGPVNLEPSAPESSVPEPSASKLALSEPPPVEPPQQSSSAEKTPEVRTASISPDQKTETFQTKRVPNRQDVSLGFLVQRFMELMLASPDSSLDMRHVIVALQTRRRRVYDITNVLEGINLVERQSANKFKWIGKCHISSFLWRNQEKFQSELENLKLVEDTLDTLIKSCAQQLFDMTDNTENAALAYVTHKDISRLKAFKEQTLLVVKAPEETKLEVPAPQEDSIQIHLKGGRGPIMVLTCDVGTGDVSGEKSDHFLTLEESRLKTTTLHTESSNPQSAVQSA